MFAIAAERLQQRSIVFTVKNRMQTATTRHEATRRSVEPSVDFGSDRAPFLHIRSMSDRNSLHSERTELVSAAVDKWWRVCLLRFPRFWTMLVTNALLTPRCFQDFQSMYLLVDSFTFNFTIHELWHRSINIRCPLLAFQNAPTGWSLRTFLIAISTLIDRRNECVHGFTKIFERLWKLVPDTLYMSRETFRQEPEEVHRS